VKRKKKKERKGEKRKETLVTPFIASAMAWLDLMVYKAQKERNTSAQSWVSMGGRWLLLPLT